MLRTKRTYNDIPFFLTRNSFTSDVNTISDLNAIRQAIKNILMTIPGERPFDFNFGGSLYGQIFENYTMELILDVQSKIANNIRIYEKRVELNDIRVLNSPATNSINVVVDFFIPDLNVNDVISIDLVRTR